MSFPALYGGIFRDRGTLFFAKPLSPRNPSFLASHASELYGVLLTIRMSDRRFTRLTNAFSKKLANHISSVHLHNFFYNFCRIHKSLRITPAMAAGLTDRVWTIADVVAMLEQKEEKAAQPKVVVLVPVKKRG